MEHLRILPFSVAWWWGTIDSFLLISLGIIIFKIIPAKFKSSLSTILGYVILAEVITTHLYLLLYQGTWSLHDSLPLHICRISVIVAGYSLIVKNQKCYEWSVYLGLPSGFHSIYTPELTQGHSLWMMIDFYFSHSMLIFAPILLTLFFNKIPRNKAFIDVFIYGNLLAIFVFPLNFIINSNYMYLAQKPIAGNPILIGQWPWYIIVVELAIILHMLFIDLVFRLHPRYPNRQIAKPVDEPEQ